MRLFAARWLRGLGIVLLCLASIFITGQVFLRIRRRLHPEPMPPEIAPYLDAPLRRKLFGSPEHIVERAGVAPGMRVLEIGPGPGLFTTVLACCVAAGKSSGSVTCVEVQSKMIELLRQRLEREEVSNVEIIQADGCHMPLPEGSFDMVFLVTVVGELPYPVAFFRECARVLKVGGVVSVTEQLCDPDFCLPGMVRRCAEAAGLEDAGYVGIPWWSYTASYRKTAPGSVVSSQ
ncbi:putative menaquinone biosynthesis methyltransferase [Ktedonobacter sp. SOSP1-52]|uniref:class I SAM-dependent methyltransferase n=1 Tax=Ktedonobacter sp. SOSP1-52 TaxID=2778366 RepID=UPI0019158C8D|nr:class I SAM-dependent methyltransferase [Ktedonobacter sp. SOSP1-52]GHO70648.1 putative menaquinone biosynthesis methyltransferase [Ktedonobacter sp. SOSP1-52]